MNIAINRACKRVPPCGAMVLVIPQERHHQGCRSSEKIGLFTLSDLKSVAKRTFRLEISCKTDVDHRFHAEI